MMLYQDALAERRRLHSGAPWQLTGVVVGGKWNPAAYGIRPAPVDAIAAGLVQVVKLPAFFALGDKAAVEVAIAEAARPGYGQAASDPWWDPGFEIRTDLPPMP